MGQLQDRSIQVVGGGVAGLTVARALALRGAQVRLTEAAPEISEVGAGLQISPNGLRVIDALGLGEALRARSVRGRVARLRDGMRGDDVARLSLVDKGDYLFVHRARLIEVLEEGARDAGVDIVLGTRAVPGAGDGLTLAADGLRSAYRQALIGGGTPTFTGQVAWRALIPSQPDSPAEAQVFMGPGRHLVSYPLAHGLRNIVAVEERQDWADEDWSQEDDPDNLRRAFGAFGGPVPEWLDQIDRVNLWGLFRHPVADRWHGSGVVLLGDAAHPTLPFLAQGANLALEDAWILAACLDALPDDQALPRYEALRHDRARRVVGAATRNARNYHLAGLPKRVAHGVLRAVSSAAPDRLLARYDWVYDYDATRENIYVS